MPLQLYTPTIVRSLRGQFWRKPAVRSLLLISDFSKGQGIWRLEHYGAKRRSLELTWEFNSGISLTHPHMYDYSVSEGWLPPCSYCDTLSRIHSLYLLSRSRYLCLWDNKILATITKTSHIKMSHNTCSKCSGSHLGVPPGKVIP